MRPLLAVLVAFASGMAFSSDKGVEPPIVVSVAVVAPPSKAVLGEPLLLRITLSNNSKTTVFIDS